MPHNAPFRKFARTSHTETYRDAMFAGLCLAKACVTQGPYSKIWGKSEAQRGYVGGDGDEVGPGGHREEPGLPAMNPAMLPVVWVRLMTSRRVRMVCGESGVGGPAENATVARLV